MEVKVESREESLNKNKAISAELLELNFKVPLNYPIW